MIRLMLLAAALAAPMPADEPRRFESRHIEEKLAGCDDAKNGCAHAEFTYVELVTGPAQVQDRINSAIRDYLLARPGDGLRLTPAEYARHFVADYQQLRSQETNFEQKWTLSKTVKELRSAAPVISLECSEWSYMGGTHGMGATQYLNFDTLTGGPVKLDAVIRNGWLPRLTAIAEVQFRAARELPATANLADAGFTFPDGRFQLNRNFGITNENLVFTYNPYEVAPYMMGPTTIEIPLAGIGDLLRPGFLR